MIVNASGRTDVPAFYMDWFMNRIQDGFFDVRNPFYPKKVSRIYMEDIDAFMFCTKNPIPLLERLNEIDKPILLDVTVTAYHKDIEPGVPDKLKIIEAIQACSRKLGADQVVVRYDPIFLSDTYDVDYHMRAFEKLCTHLEGYVKRICVSFMDEYKNVKNNAHLLRYRSIEPFEYEQMALAFMESGRRHSIEPYTCHEGNLLEPYGFSRQSCMSPTKAFEMTSKVFGLWKARDCGCVQMADIGTYNTCKHLCRYCYANFDEKKVAQNVKAYDPRSSLLCSQLEWDDEIQRRTS